jgi:hypothetical protein
MVRSYNVGVYDERRIESASGVLFGDAKLGGLLDFHCL